MFYTRVLIGVLFFLIFHKSTLAESLFVQQNFVALTSDSKAIRIGDKLTVLVRENTSAISSADTSTEREADFGANASYSSDPGKVLGDHDASARATLGVGRSASGKGKTARAGKIVAEITVAVNAVEANGDIWVKGEKSVTINDESQLVQIEGAVRRLDILSGNVVESNRLANVKIKIAGEGDLTNSQRQGWLTKVFDWLRIF
ncbi:flagellar basal body L-ring protein FlgH [Chitinibacteraceae bacterium HSL-7]